MINTIMKRTSWNFSFSPIKSHTQSFSLSCGSTLKLNWFAGTVLGDCLKHPQFWMCSLFAAIFKFVVLSIWSISTTANCFCWYYALGEQKNLISSVMAFILLTRNKINFFLWNKCHCHLIKVFNFDSYCAVSLISFIHRWAVLSKLS